MKISNAFALRAFPIPLSTLTCAALFSLAVCTSPAWAGPAAPASNSPAVERASADLPPRLLAACTDQNGDGFTNLPDLALFAQKFLSGLYVESADFNCDGIVGLSDLFIMKKAFFSVQPFKICC